MGENADENAFHSEESSVHASFLAHELIPKRERKKKKEGKSGEFSKQLKRRKKSKSPAGKRTKKKKNIEPDIPEEVKEEQLV